MLHAVTLRYAPQVFETATRLLSQYAVPSLQFELSKGSVPSTNAYTRALKPQVCMNLRLLVYIDRCVTECVTACVTACNGCSSTSTGALHAPRTADPLGVCNGM